MPRHVRGALLARFNFVDGITFYTRYGDWIAWICAVLTCALVGVSLLRSRRQGTAQ
jgi:apolipoprotein N-acyltransferase